MKKGLNLWAVALSAMVVISMFVCIGCEDNDDDDSSTGGLSIAPSSVSFAAQVTNVSFTVYGGTAPYSWAVTDSTLGSVVSAGSTVIYTSTTNAGQNVVSVVDGATNTATAVVNQS